MTLATDYINHVNEVLSERPWRPDHHEYAGDADGSDLYAFDEPDLGLFTIQQQIEDNTALRLPGDDVTITVDRLGRQHWGYPVSAETRAKIGRAVHRTHTIKTIRKAIEDIERMVASL